ncbi:MAG TPA: alkaline phosphatase PhoX [Actinomycetota bacterium]|nr:alkaline phosphatase PhoX [Actinomycetota bacterium]
MDRRAFLKSSLTATAAFTTLGASFWRAAFATHPAPEAGTGPYGDLGTADANGIRLPEGFSSRILARSAELVPGTAYAWHHVPDGAATFATADGGWIYVCNSESPVPMGGVSAIRFDAAGDIAGPLAAYRILEGSSINCAGGPTPWGTWLSCEEHPAGLVWECDPTGVLPGIPRPALGTFSHEAAAVDPEHGHVYLTEDQSDSLFYRFTPASPRDLSSGLLEAASVAPDGSVQWLTVPQPNSVSPATRHQVPSATRFRGGEGAWFDAVARTVYFTTKGDDKVWAYNVDNAVIEVFFDSRATPGSPLNGVDNLTVSPGREIFVCEDHSSAPHQLVMLSAIEGKVVASTFLELVGHEGSELTGVCFDPSGRRMYLSSQRGPLNVPPIGLGITYEISGPFNV